MTENENTEDESPSSTNQIRLVVIVAVLMIIGVLAFNYFWLIKDSEKSSIGGMFGVANALFSGLAFGGIIYTILLQRNELELQRKELRLTRNEFKDQNNTLKRQRFENTFFNMLNLQSQIVEAMQIGTKKSREVIDQASGHLTQFLINVAGNNAEKTGMTDEELEGLHQRISGGYLSYYKQFENSFNHYFRHLYHIYKFIYFSDLTKEEKDFYSSLTRAQLSQNELYLIAFNGIIEDYGYPKFTYLMKEYNILKNFSWETIRTLSHQELIKYKLRSVEYPFLLKNHKREK